MIVLDQDGFAKVLAVISAPADANGIFFKSAKAGRRLSGIQNFRACAIHGTHKPMRERRDAAQALQQIQRHAFARQESARGGRYTRRDLSRSKFGAVVADDFNSGRRVKKLKNFGEQFDPGQDKPGLCDNIAARALSLSYGRFGRNVPGANVFREE
jgi:hypothetical protein